MEVGSRLFRFVLALMAVAGAGLMAVGPTSDRADSGSIDGATDKSPWGATAASPDGPSVILIRARGRLGTEDMELRINGDVVSTWRDVSRTEETYRYAVERPVTVEQLRVGISADGGWPASLVVDWVRIDGITHQSEAVTTSSRGSWNPATGCRPGFKRSEWLQCHIGWFDYQSARGTSLLGPPHTPEEPTTTVSTTTVSTTTVPTTEAPVSSSSVPSTSQPEAERISIVTVRARGRLGTEDLELRINGQAVRTWHDLSTGFKDHRFEVRRPLTVERLEVAMVGGGWPQAVVVDRIDVDGVVHQTESAETRSSGSWTSATGCRPGFKRSEWLHCNDGHFEYRAAAGTVLAAAGDTGATPSAVRRHLLVMTKASVYSHPSIDDGIALVDRLAAEEGFDVTHSVDSTLFEDPGAVAVFDAVLFLNTDSVVFETAAQKRAFRSFIEGGKGFIGIHGAAATHWNQDRWDWYRDLVGQRFVDHPTTPNQLATVRVIDRSHPSTGHLPPSWEVRDEWYNFEGLPSGVDVLLTVDESTYGGGTMGTWHPIAWTHRFGPGQSPVWYSNLGHEPALYRNPDYVEHVRGGIRWVLDRQG